MHGSSSVLSASGSGSVHVEPAPVAVAHLPGTAWSGIAGGLRHAAWTWRVSPEHVRRRRWAEAAAVVAGSFAIAFWLLQSGAPLGPGTPAVVVESTLSAWLAMNLYIVLLGAFGQDVEGVEAYVLRRGAAVPLRAPRGRTALLVPIRNEDVASTFAGVAATWLSLAHEGLAPACELHILSDTSDPLLRQAERNAFSRLCSTLPHADRLHYRLRARPTGRKVGNLAEFCHRRDVAADYIVVLDADSVMDGRCIATLVSLMDAHPEVGIIQTVPETYGAVTLHSWARHFAAVTAGRLASRGWSLLNGDSGAYWGHNAILRLDAFVAHCALSPLRGKGALSGDLLSHDVVEAALMRRAGYVCLQVPGLRGSFEMQPADLVEEVVRDRRWCRGNLQHLRLLAEPGVTLANRLQFLVGAGSYVVALLWLVSLVTRQIPVLSACLCGSRATTSAGSTVLWSMNLVSLLLPGLLGLAVARREGARRRSLATSWLLWQVVQALTAPVLLVQHSIAVVRSAIGPASGWSPARRAQTPTLRDCWSMFVVESAIGATVLGASLALGGIRPLLLTVVLPLLAAAPVAFLTGHPVLGRALIRDLGLHAADLTWRSRTLDVRAWLLAGGAPGTAVRRLPAPR